MTATRRPDAEALHAERLVELGRAVARVAHELNKPLGTARLLAELLEREPLTSVEIEHVRSLRHELEHAAALVRDLLLLARRPALRSAPVRLADAVREAVAEHERDAAAAGVRILLDLPDDLPPIRADASELRHVFANLIQNALQAIASVPADGRDRWIAVRARAATPPSGPVVVLEVEDTGPGLAPEVLPHIFEPFFTTKPAGEGTGIGLAIVQDIVEAHGGEVEAENAVGGGALFRITLPAVEGDAPAAAQPPGVRAAPSSSAPAVSGPVPGGGSVPAAGPAPSADATVPHGLRVLVIDDEPGLQRAIRRVLELYGCEVVSALTGEEGLRRAAGERFDLILCDVRLPGLDGRELYARLKTAAPAAARRLAFMTGDTVSDEIRRFLQATGRPAVAKPFGREQLAALLREAGPAQV